jgi:hypothetical protein
MKFIKRTFLTILILTAVGLMFHGWFYRHLVTYKPIGFRTNYSATGKKPTDLIDANIDERAVPNIEQIIELGNSINSKQLNFTISNNEILTRINL